MRIKGHILGSSRAHRWLSVALALVLVSSGASVGADSTPSKIGREIKQVVRSADNVGAGANQIRRTTNVDVNVNPRRTFDAVTPPPSRAVSTAQPLKPNTFPSIQASAQFGATGTVGRRANAAAPAKATPAAKAAEDAKTVAANVGNPARASVRPVQSSSATAAVAVDTTAVTTAGTKAKQALGPHLPSKVRENLGAIVRSSDQEAARAKTVVAKNRAARARQIRLRNDKTRTDNLKRQQRNARLKKQWADDKAAIEARMSQPGMFESPDHPLPKVGNRTFSGNGTGSQLKHFKGEPYTAYRHVDYPKVKRVLVTDAEGRAMFQVSPGNIKHYEAIQKPGVKGFELKDEKMKKNRHVYKPTDDDMEYYRAIVDMFEKPGSK